MNDAAALDRHAKAIRKLGKRTIENVIEVGRHLTEAKTIVKKLGSSWPDWLKHEFDMKPTTADNFMNIFQRKSELPTVGGSDLSLKSLYMLAAPTTSQQARDEIAARLKKGEKVKHKDVADVTRKNRQPKQLTGLAAEIEAAVKAAASHGMIADEAKAQFGNRHNEQTVATTFNSLKKTGVLRDSGEHRKGRAKGGRAAEVLVWVPEVDRVQPTKKPKPAKATVINLDEHRLIAMIEDDSICLIIAKWAVGKSEKARGTKAYRLIRPLIGKERSDLADFIKKSAFGGAFADEQWNLHGGKSIGAIEFKTGK
jgi:hypothetical protein